MSLPPFETLTVDYLTVSIPDTDSRVLWDVSQLVSAAGGVVVSGRVSGTRYSLGDGGSVFIYARPNTERFILQFSGAALAELRRRLMLHRLVVALGRSALLRVTRLDIALDLPLDAPLVMHRIYRRHLDVRRVKLGGRGVRRGREVRIGTERDDGCLVGTDYYRHGKTSMHLLRLYCKRTKEIEDGRPDPGDRLRVELSVRTGKAGVTLLDVVSPTSLFWHKVDLPEIGGRPVDVPRWRRRRWSPDFLKEVVMPTDSDLFLAQRRAVVPQLRETLRLAATAGELDACRMFLAATVNGEFPEGPWLVFERPDGTLVRPVFDALGEVDLEPISRGEGHVVSVVR